MKDGNNFCLSCLEEQSLVALLQGSDLNQMIHLRQVVTKRKGSKLRGTTFQSQLDLKLEGVGLEDLTRYVL